MPDILDLLDFAILPQGRETEIKPLAGRVDGYPDEEHKLSMEITEYPVESGKPLTDNAVKLREEVRLTGVVSDLVPLSIEDAGRRAGHVWDDIVQLFNDRTLVTVITGLRVYRNMLVTKAIAPRNSRTGEALIFQITLSEIQHAETGLERLTRDTIKIGGPAEFRTSLVNAGLVASEEFPLARYLGLPERFRQLSDNLKLEQWERLSNLPTTFPSEINRRIDRIRGLL